MIPHLQSFADAYIINKISVPGTRNGLVPQWKGQVQCWGLCCVCYTTGLGRMAFRRFGMRSVKGGQFTLPHHGHCCLLFCRPPSHLSDSATRSWSPRRPLLSSILLMLFVLGWDRHSYRLTCSQAPCSDTQVCVHTISIAHTVAQKATCPRLNF